MREALMEREVLLAKMAHIAAASCRTAASAAGLMLRLGLFIYDHLNR